MRKSIQAGSPIGPRDRSIKQPQIGYCAGVTPSPKDLVERALALVRSHKALGMRLQMSKGRLNQIVHGERLSVTNCLRLSELINESPSVVLRAYQYVAEAEILERVYDARTRLPRQTAEVVDALKRLEPEDRRSLSAVIKKLAAFTELHGSRP
jgi:hypothetical protein